MMQLIVNTQTRSEKLEWMDDLSLNGDVLYDTLDKLALINKWLGGSKVTITGLNQLLHGHPKAKPLTIIDLGCGGGDVLRDVARFGNKKGYRLQLTGIDANEEVINYARLRSRGFPEIRYVQGDIFSEILDQLDYDIVLTSLFLHHFREEQLVGLMNRILPRASVGVVVNDLHRHPLAYYLFRLLCVPIANRMVREDGLTSILKGFKRQELIDLSDQIGADFRIKWKWAFRYQWIIRKK